MTEQSGRDPFALWSDWLEASSRAWAETMEGAKGSGTAPYEVFQRWMEASGVGKETQSPSFADPMSMLSVMDPRGGYLRWLEQATQAWQKMAESGELATELAPGWVKMFEEIRDNLLKESEVPSDPLQLAVQWYNATSGPFAEFLGELIEREEFLEPTSRLLNHYASFYNVFQRTSEDYIKSLSLPVRSDITRVASMITALEEKVEGLSEVFEDFQYGDQEPASAASVEALEKRMDRLEGKLDRVLSALEGGSQNGPSRVAATEAARRKAEELGVDLSRIEGTGSGGQVTVEDVRREGDR